MFRDVPGCSGMFRNVPECSEMFHVPGFIDARVKTAIVIRQKQNFLSANLIAPADSIRNVFRLIGSSFV